MRLSEIPRISEAHFRNNNRVGWLNIPSFLRFQLDGRVRVQDGWTVVGMNPLTGSPLMIGRDTCIAIMGFHPDDGHVWVHFPAPSHAARDFQIVGLVEELVR